MLTKRLPYKFLASYLIFSTILMLAFSLIAYHNSGEMVKEMDEISPLVSEQRAVQSLYRERMAESLIAIAFYIFVLAFIFSLFFSRKFLIPIKELYKGAKLLKEGNLDLRLEARTGDELEEVTNAFNEMAETIRDKTRELGKKDLYIDAMLDPMWVTNDDNLIVEINPAFTRLFGYERDEVIGASVLDFLDGDGESSMKKLLQETAWDESFTWELSVISKAGAPVPVLISGSPVFERGVLVGRIGVLKDFRRETALREALRDEKERADIIMDSMVDDLLVINRDYEIVKANMAARITAGRDVKGERCHDVFHKQGERCFLHGVECPVKAVFDTGKPFKAVHEHSEGGKKSYLEIIAYPITDRRNEAVNVVEVMRDVTERKRFEEEIEQKNKELTTLNSVSRILSQSLKAEDIFNSVLDKVIGLLGMDGGGIFFLDALGRELRCEYHRGLSADFVRSTGRIKVGDDIPGRVALSAQSIITPDVSRDPRGEKSVLKHSGIRGYAAIPVRGKEKMLGVFYIFSFNAHNFTSEEGRILNSISEMMGIAIENIKFYEKMRELYTQQRQRRAEEQKNLLALSTMLAAAPDIKKALNSGLSIVKDSCRADFIWLLSIDVEGNLVLRAATSGEMPEGATVFPEGVSSIERHAVEKKKPVIISGLGAEPKFFLPSHLRVYDTACSVPLSVGDRTLGAFTVYYRTLKEPREEDIDFLQTASSMISVALERARLYESAINKEKEMGAMKTEFVKEASHAFRTPLSAIVGMSEMIKHGDVAGEKVKDYIDTILSEGRRLSGIVSDLLDVARIESGKEVLKEQEIDFGGFLKDIDESFSGQIKDRGIMFKTSAESGIIGYKGDVEKLRRLIRNLLDNALTYSDDGTAVEVAVRRRGDAVLLEVKDEGWGMDEEDVKHAGDKFYRGGNVKGTKGAGLGLSLCRNIAGMHGGRLLIESARGKGTTVTVELPINRINTGGTDGTGEAAVSN